MVRVQELALPEQESLLREALFGVDGHLTWGRSISAVSAGHQDIEHFLEKEWGQYKVYAIEHAGRLAGLFALYHVSACNCRADFLCWIEGHARCSFVPSHAWVAFLFICRQINVRRLFARIKSSNTPALRAAARFGFVECGRLPEYFIEGNGFLDVVAVTRQTMLSPFETKIAKRIHVPV